MSTRTVPVQVNNEYIKGAGVPVGAAGSHNDVVLEISFSALWDGLAKKITWLDAKGENPTLTILTTDMLKNGETSVYLVKIPAEPKAYAGDMTMTIKGATVTGDVETRATLSTSCTFRVLPSAYDNSADESGDVTPTQAEQLQAEIDTILSTISEAAESATDAASSETAAAASATGAAAAQTAAEAAQTAAETAEGNAMTYKGDAETAKTAAEAARAAAETAQGAAASSKTEAETAAGTATTKAGEASASAAEALASQQAAAGSASSAGSSATSASGSASAAAGSASAAESSAQQAASSETSASGSAAAAAQSAQEAAAAAGGGVTSFNGRGGAVFPATGDYTADMVGAEASGAADTALSTHNAASGAHQNLNIAFENAAARANIYSGLSLSNILGRIQKWFFDLGTAAFSAASDFAAEAHTHTKIQITDFEHTHAQSEVNGLSDALSGKASSTHAENHATGGSDPLAPADIGACKSPVKVVVSLPYTGWVLNSTSTCYEQTAACEGLLETDTQATVRIEPVGSTDAAAQLLTDAAYGAIFTAGGYAACTVDGQLYCRGPAGGSAPGVDFSVSVCIAR